MKYTAREAAEFVGISASTLRRWANDEKVPYFWQNGVIMFRDEHLDKIIEYAQESKLQRVKMYKSTKKKDKPEPEDSKSMRWQKFVRKVDQIYAKYSSLEEGIV